MGDKAKGFVLTPSRLGRPVASEDTAKPIFTGLKQSKLGGSLGILADSKLTSTLASQSNVKTDTEEKISEPAAPAKPTFSFTPLNKEELENKPLTNPFQPLQSSIKSDGEEKTAGTVKSGDKASEKKDIPVAKAIFGQNLSEKVILPHADEKEEIVAAEKSEETGDFSSVSAIPTEEADNQKEQKTLSESAAEYTESHQNKRKYDEVDVVTGEEEESNVVQTNVRLYLFNGDNKSWKERGRGLIRLNDTPSSTPGHLKSRLVMRTTGTLLVVLNTKLWAEMVCEKVNEKNIRISAMDDDVVRIFLLSGSPKDTEKLFNALECRLDQLRKDKEEEGEPSPKKAATSEL